MLDGGGHKGDKAYPDIQILSEIQHEEISTGFCLRNRHDDVPYCTLSSASMHCSLPCRYRRSRRIAVAPHHPIRLSAMRINVL